MDVSSLKRQAAELEQQGNTAEAARLYCRILDKLEGSPGLKRELPLYVKAGDALLKAGNPSGAIEMYDRAAEHYAQHGSSKSVLVLCLRVLRADRKQTDVYIRYARLLFDYGHTEASRTVLVDYATRAKLAKTLERLESLATVPDEDARVHLQQLFSRAGRAKKPPAQEPKSEAKPPAPTPQPPEAVVSEDITPPTEEPPPTEEVAEEPAEAQPAHLAGKEERKPPSGLPLLDLETEAPQGAPAPPQPPRREPVRSRDVLMSEPRQEQRRRPAWLLPAAAVIVLAVVGGGLIALDIVPLGGGTGVEGTGSDMAAAPVAPTAPESDSGDTAGVALGDSASQFVELGDSAGTDSVATPTAAADSLAADTPAIAQPSVTDSARAAAARVPPPPVAAADSGVLTPPSRLPTGATGEGPVLAVEGLEILSVEQLTAGYRVVQRLETGGRLELTVTGLDEAAAAGAGALRVTTLPGDTAMGSVRFGDRLISARALVAADVLEGLLRRIVEVR